MALFHELVHAYYSVQGLQMAAESPPSETNTLYEAMCVGLPPHFHTRPYSENALRRELKLKPRTEYKV
ncbi:MAG: hypothetical protein KatS3mg102_2171 [Planctomycetota bacterium]|nr:MAG: hypothetical protein KatS3mg102_2171 [Planctomycetota bacterium]